MTALAQLIANAQILLYVSSTMLFVGVIYGLSTQTSLLGINILSHSSAPPRSKREKRRESRTKCNLHIEILDQTENISVVGQLLNMSLGGACVSTATTMHMGDRVLGRLPTLREGVNRIAGRIIWTRRVASNTLYGIQFITPRAN